MAAIKMSETACKEFKKFLDDNNVTNTNIRIFLVGIGCSGPQFNLALSEKNIGDVSEQIGDLTFLVAGNLFEEFKGFEIKCPEENGFDSFTIEPFEIGEFNGCASCGGNCGH